MDKKKERAGVQMEMVSVPILVPQEMAAYLKNQEDSSFERNAMILYPMIRNKTISHGRAAEILGVHKFDLIDFYDKMGMPYLNLPVQELEEEIAGFADLRRKIAI